MQPPGPLTNTETPPFRRRIFARMWRLMAPSADTLYRHAKFEVLTDLPSRIVELGPGVGTNFRRYPRGATVVAFEPNSAMHDDLRKAADEQGLTLELHSEDLRSAGLPDDSEDAVVSTLVLCSVGDQAEMVREIRRILKPGGRFVFVEHVASESPRLLRVQKLLRRPWAALGDGCDLAAPTVAAIDGAGFTSVSATAAPVGPVIDPSRPSYWGVATK